MDEAVREIMESVKRAYELTEAVCAKGSELDSLAAARQLLRTAYHTAGEIMKKEEPHG